jgi:ribosomal protein L29
MNQDKINQIAKLKLELSKIRMEIKTGKNKNTNAHKKIKKQIAQLLTAKEETK